MEFVDVIRRRRTTNGFFEDRPVSREHQHRLMKAAARAPSHMNSQPWRFVLIENDELKKDLGEIAGRSMKRAMEGPFFTDNRKYFRFSREECAEKGDGMLFSDMPDVLRPLVHKVFESDVFTSISKYGVSKILGDQERKLVERSPLLLAVLMEPLTWTGENGEMDSYYQFAHGVTMGMALENLWLTCTDLGMGIQFVSMPHYYPEEWRTVKELVGAPEELKLMALMRLGYLPDDEKKPSINWKSSFRKPVDKYVFRERYGVPEKTDAGNADSDDVDDQAVDQG